MQFLATKKKLVKFVFGIAKVYVAQEKNQWILFSIVCTRTVFVYFKAIDTDEWFNCSAHQLYCFIAKR